MKYISRSIILIFAGFFIVSSCIHFSGCQGKKVEYGKFTPEQMKDISTVNNTDLPLPSGGITISVMNETVTVEDIISQPNAEDVLKPLAKEGSYELFKMQAKPMMARVVMGKISDIMVYHLASKDHSPAMESQIEKIVDKEVNRFVATYNNDRAQAEKAFKQMGIDNWNDFRDYKRKLIITQSYMSNKIKDEEPVTHSEMVERYNELKKEFFEWEGKIKFRLIDIIPNKLTAEQIKSSEGETAEQAALRLANEIKSKLKSGADFAKLAEEYSEGIGKNNGGLWEPVTDGSLAAPYDKLEKAAKTMNPGDISDIITADGHVFIMKLEDKTEAGVTPFEDVHDRIEEEIRMIRQREEYNRLMAEIIEQANITNMEQFTEYCLQEAFKKFKE